MGRKVVEGHLLDNEEEYESQRRDKKLEAHTI